MQHHSIKIGGKKDIVSYTEEHQATNVVRVTLPTVTHYKIDSLKHRLPVKRSIIRRMISALIIFLKKYE